MLPCERGGGAEQKVLCCQTEQENEGAEASLPWCTRSAEPCGKWVCAATSFVLWRQAFLVNALQNGCWFRRRENSAFALKTFPLKPTEMVALFAVRGVCNLHLALERNAGRK